MLCLVKAGLRISARTICASASEEFLEIVLKPSTFLNLLFDWVVYDVRGDVARTMLGIRREEINRQVDVDLGAEMRCVATAAVGKRKRKLYN